MFDYEAAIDLTVPIGAGMVLYPGDAPPRLRRLSSIEDGDPLTASELILGCHVGTHVDAPAHFLRDGLTVDRLAPAHFFGPAVVLDLTSRARIELADVEKLPVPARHHVLLKTDNSALLRAGTFQSAYSYTTPAAMRRLLDSAPLSVGIDYYSFDPPAEAGYPAHRLIAAQGLPAYVCLDLGNVAAGHYFFTAFALPVTGAEGLPVRAVLWPRGASGRANARAVPPP